MKKYYCNGKKGICPYGDDCSVMCGDCEYYNGEGGAYIEVDSEQEEKRGHGMSICKDCIHYELCQLLSDQYGIPKVPSCQCGVYKPTADVVEVVRCKDCKHYRNDDDGWCERHSEVDLTPEDYCSYGERKGI